jgi:hypothetical protein
MLLIFHKTDQQTIRKNALIFFVINLLAWSIAAMGKSLHLPKIVFIVFFSIYLVCVIAFLVYIYRFLDPKDKYRPLHPDVAALTPELRSRIFGIYSMTFLFGTLPFNLFNNLLGLEPNSFINILIYFGLGALMAWVVYRGSDLNKIKNTNTNKLPNNSIAISDKKAADFFIIGYILVMAIIAFLLYKNSI